MHMRQRNFRSLLPFRLLLSIGPDHDTPISAALLQHATQEMVQNASEPPAGVV